MIRINNCWGVDIMVGTAVKLNNTDDVVVLLFFLLLLLVFVCLLFFCYSSFDIKFMGDGASI